MKARLAITMAMIAAVTAAGVMTTTTITTFNVFAQNDPSNVNQLIKACMYNNASTRRALEGNNTTVQSQLG
jgi:Na+-translocating ferredoxin:NAD+ oxidoreductase RnfG subunit